MALVVRPYAADDIGALYEICLKTSDSGKDASALYADPRLVGHVYSAPYGVLVPDWCFVAEDEEGIVGYVVGVPDTEAFEDRLERDWWPELRATYRDPGPPPFSNHDNGRCYQIHHPSPPPAQVVARFPAHMHMNLLARARGQGGGRALFDAWADRARLAGVSGVHVGVSPKNAGAAAFWQAVGFKPLVDVDPTNHPALWFGQTL